MIVNSLLGKKKRGVTALRSARPALSLAQRLRPAHVLRIVIAWAVIAVWLAFSVSFVYGRWLQGTQLQAAQRPPQAETAPKIAQILASNTQDPAGATPAAPGTGSTGLTRDVLQRARSFCSQGQSLLLISDAGATYQLADYFMYPRKTISIGPDQPFGQADLAAHAGGCLVDFGQESAARLIPFEAELTQVICSSEGCLYTIGKPQ